MSATTGIEWTDATWNPVSGCTKVSPGCDNCYAETLAERFRGTPGHYFEHGFDVHLREDKLMLPLRWRKPRRIFVNSMSDLFHDQVPGEYIARVFAVMAYAHRHTFQLLTKRHARMRSLLSSESFVELFDREFCKLPDWAERCPDPDDAGHLMDGPLRNVWLGVSAENQQWADIRIPALLDTPAAVRFVSAEPLLGPIDLNTIPSGLRMDGGPRRDSALIEACQECGGWGGPCGHGLHLVKRRGGIDWAIVGGESGRAARPMQPAWVRQLRDQCQQAGIPFFFKQWGEYGVGEAGGPMVRMGKKTAGRELDGRTWNELPTTAAHP